jgi:hypothetical protein
MSSSLHVARALPMLTCRPLLHSNLPVQQDLNSADGQQLIVPAVPLAELHMKIGHKAISCNTAVFATYVCT